MQQASTSQKPSTSRTRFLTSSELRPSDDVWSYGVRISTHPEFPHDQQSISANCPVADATSYIPSDSQANHHYAALPIRENAQEERSVRSTQDFWAPSFTATSITPQITSSEYTSGSYFDPFWPHEASSASFNGSGIPSWPSSSSNAFPLQHGRMDPESFTTPYVKIKERDRGTEQFISPTANSTLINPQSIFALPASVEEGSSSLEEHCKDEDTDWEDRSSNSLVSSKSGIERSLSGTELHPADSHRRRRSLTTDETAKCWCQICGKPFRRTYNLRAHVETHNPLREQPFECVFPDCSKRFVRKTDLERHKETVSRRVFVNAGELLTLKRFTPNQENSTVTCVTRVFHARTPCEGQ